MSRETIPMNNLKSVRAEERVVEPQRSDFAASTSANRRCSVDGNGRLRIEDYLSHFGVPFCRKDEPTSDGRTLYVLNECPFNPEHGSRGESCIMQDSTGKLSYKCHHNSCSEHGWKDVKEVIGHPNRAHYHEDMTSKGSRKIAEVSNDEHTVNQQVIDALKEDPELYQRSGELVRIVTDAQPSDGIRRPICITRIVAVTLPYLRDRISRLIDFRRPTGTGGKLTPVSVPSWCVQGVDAARNWPGVPPILGIIRTPVPRKDGSLVSKPGLDGPTGLFLDAADEIPDVPDCPSKDDAVAAAQRLIEVFADFPFAKPEHKSALLAYILTPLARHAFDGPAPLFLFDANVRGSGKSLLVDLVSIITSGQDISRMCNPKDDEECRKRITALALAGDASVLIDNVAGPLGCPSLDAALTSTRWKDRLLGKSEIVELPLNVTWAATANNAMLSADTSRRVAHIRLESPEERPEERDGFRRPDIREYVRENRLVLLTDALTILSAYLKAGMPNQGLKPWGSFEGWSQVVRQAVVWCGFPDPGLTRQDLVDSADREAVAFRQLLMSWSDIDPKSQGLSVNDLLQKLIASPGKHVAIRDAILELAPPARDGLPSVRQLGNRFAHLRRRVLNGRFLDYHKGAARSRLWYIESVRESSQRTLEFPDSDSDDSSDSFSGQS